MNPDFVTWLAENVPAEFAKLVELVQRFVEQQYPPVPMGGGNGPIEQHVGQEHALTTKALSSEEIDALGRSAAEAEVKGRAIAFVKGAIAIGGVAL